MKEIINNLKSSIGKLFPCCNIEKGEARFGVMHSLNDKDIMDFKDNYPEGYITYLMNRLRAENIDSSLTQKDIFRMLFGIEYDDDKVLLRPLGKMKRDLINDL